MNFSFDLTEGIGKNLTESITTNVTTEVVKGIVKGIGAFLGELFKIVSIIILIISIISLIQYLYSSFCYYRIFKKANIESPGCAFIPFYRRYLMFETLLGKGDGFLGLLMAFSLLIPGIGPLVFLGFYIYMCYLLSEAFDRKEGFVIVLVLFHDIGLAILAFGDRNFKQIKKEA